jgi:uncharacterized membrane protein
MPKQSKHPLALALFSLFFALMVAHAIYHYFVLPDQIATHFGFSGEADGRGPKTIFFLWYSIMTGILAAIFIGVNHILPSVHTSLLNIPGKEYWLAPERLHDTLSHIRSALLLFGSGALLLVLDIVHQGFQVSLGYSTKLDHFLSTFAVYLLFCVLWTAGLYRRFGRKG